MFPHHWLVISSKQWIVLFSKIKRFWKGKNKLKVEKLFEKQPFVNPIESHPTLRALFQFWSAFSETIEGENVYNECPMHLQMRWSSEHL